MPFAPPEQRRRKQSRTEGILRLEQSRIDKEAKLGRLRPVEREYPLTQIYTPISNNAWPNSVTQIMQSILTSSTSVTSNITWAYDNASLTGGVDWHYEWNPSQTFNAWAVNAPEPLTQEEADRRLAATRAAAHKSSIRRKKAVKRGRKLLLGILTLTQQEEYARTKSFTVAGADGKIYKLRKGGTTHQIDESGLPVLSHCIHLPYSYIDEDTLVAVKLMLETDPDTFLKIANTSRLSASPVGIAVPAIPQEMTDRAAALAAGLNGVNERFAQLSIAAANARNAARRLGRAFEEANGTIQEAVDVVQARIQNAADYGDYAREVEHVLVAEGTGGLDLPFTTRQNHAARLLGQAQDIAGVPVAA